MYVCMGVCMHTLFQLPSFMGMSAWYIDKLDFILIFKIINMKIYLKMNYLPLFNFQSVFPKKHLALPPKFNEICMILFAWGITIMFC